MKPSVVCFGEILWDVFPDRKVIGGAPLNVALRLHSFGTSVAIVSCLGADDSGKEASDYLNEEHLDLTYIQQHPQLKTGEVLITLDAQKNATYEISKPVAWDIIKLDDQLVALVKETPFFIFGSLALRGLQNVQTMEELLKHANTTIFDVNLRAPHYDIGMVYELMQRSDVVKMNDDELEEISIALGCEETTLESRVKWLATISNTKTLCVTKGAHGACLYQDGSWYDHSGYRVAVVDTVGAGDSFFGSLVQSLFLDKEDPALALSKACALGALVASKAGANCSVSFQEIRELMQQEQ